MDAEPPGWADLLAEHRPDVAGLARRLRTTIRAAAPDLTERVYRGWHGLGLHDPKKGYIAAIFPRDEDVLVGFEHGAELPDPRNLLRGEGRQVRYLRFVPEAATPTEADLEFYLDLALER